MRYRPLLTCPALEATVGYVSHELLQGHEVGRLVAGYRLIESRRHALFAVAPCRFLVRHVAHGCLRVQAIWPRTALTLGAARVCTHSRAAMSRPVAASCSPGSTVMVVQTRQSLLG